MNNSIMDKPATKRDIENLRQELTGKMATKDELKKLELVTKEEIRKLATKEEVKKLATKDDLKNLATKDELKKLATKDELKKLEKRMDNVSSAVSQIQYQLTFFETKEESDRKFNILLTAIDGLTQKVTDFQTEKAAGEHTFQRHERKLENHEERIEQLEMSM
ncbi:hypothetical protein H8E88_20385 [candidate division KSB1 bacterium]|nr:hypothetical protein [candidate division KSB1 bacterium]MBL7094338.1 hypothetical protein [candidate division KSB1 bacterium]